jgi:hypothetical protein
MRGERLVLCFIGAVLLGGCATQPRLGDSVDAPVPTTIQAVLADPLQYHHKFIELHGLVDACTPWGCNILAVDAGTIPAKDARVTGIQFDFLPEPGSPPEKPGDDFVDRATDLLEQAYRFSEVTLVGRYDAKCALGYDPDDQEAARKKQQGEFSICLDHHGDLRVQRVLAVYKRWPASAGALWGYAQKPLSPMPPDLTESLFTSFRGAALMANPDLDEWEAEHRAFVDPKEPDRGILCICRAKQCDGKWPAMADDLVPAPANPYQCTVGIRTKIGWRFPPAWFE